jgi:hypothetical protein
MAGPRKVTQQEYIARLRELVKGDWSKLENDDPELMAEMRRYLGIESDGATHNGPDDADVSSECEADE